MNRKRVFLLYMVGIVVISLLILLNTTLGRAKTPVKYEFPAVVYWASGDVGSYPYALNAAMAEKMAPVLGCKFRMIPGNDADRINMLRAGKVHLSFFAADNYWASMGLAQYSNFALGPQPLRMIWAGWPDFAGSTGLATITSGIKTPYDLKGKRLVRIVGTAWSIEGIRGSLAFGKLNLEDVTIIDVPTTGAAYKALAEGKGDFVYGTNTAPGTYEIEASRYGLYLVRYSHEDKEGWERYRKNLPYHIPGYCTMGPGTKPGEKVPIPLFPMPITSTLESQSEEFVYAICKAIYAKMDEICAAYPGNEAMRPERIKPEATLMAPFHPGAIKFFKEVGIWRESHEVANRKRLAQLEKVNKRWLAFLDEAHEKMSKTGKKVDSSKEWRDIIEKEVGLLPQIGM